MSYYVPVPDNMFQFYAFVNLVINNRNNVHIVGDYTNCPKQIGPYKVTYKRNEVNEKFIVLDSLKAKCFVEMIIDQFTLLRTHWDTIKEYEQYPNASKY